MNFITDKIVFSTLKNMKFGHITVTNYDGEKFYLGNKKSLKRAKLAIKKKGFTINIISKGSIGLAESYMRGEFETDNLTNLIEIIANNIKTVHKFAGVILESPFTSMLKLSRKYYPWVPTGLLLKDKSRRQLHGVHEIL